MSSRAVGERSPDSGNVDTIDHARVRVLRMTRPAKLNALTTGLFDALHDALAAARTDESVHCIVLTGTGRAFTVGMDVTEMNAATVADIGRGFEPCLDEIVRFPKPLIAAVNGLAVGFGATVLTHCDLVIAADDARFRFPFVELGLVPEAASSATLPALLGQQQAARLLLSGEWLDAERAAAIGLVAQVVTSDRLLEHALHVAATIAAHPLESLIATKALLVAARADSIDQARVRERSALARLMGAPANRRAVERLQARTPMT